MRVFVDRGGTFTDLVAVGEDKLYVAKTLSQNSTPQAILDLVAQVEGANPGRPVILKEVRLGTTVATNAVLERRGEPTVLITNKGFGDALIIGYQNRADIFALDLKRPEPLFCHVIELDCRVDKSGNELAALSPEHAREALGALKEKTGIKSAAIVFMHGYKYPAHELALAQIARDLNFEQISVSHQVSNLVRYVGRGDTTLVDAYLTPVLRQYVEGVAASLGSAELSFMKSDGGLAARDAFAGKDAILSGPAGGVVGAIAAARDRAAGALVGFDMGGTSTDVFYYDGTIQMQNECTIGGVRVRAPMVAVHTVAAGGGSILSFDGSRFAVGPQSAGADPGPACYGLGGPATVTDANIVLGRLSSSDFPMVFGPDKNALPDKEAALKHFSAIAKDSGYGRPEAVAEGFLHVAVEKMAQAIRRVSLQKGHDLADTTLVAYGGAGGQHACAIAEALGIGKILLSPLAGVLSAYGIGATAHSASAEATVALKLSEATLKSLDDRFNILAEQNLRTLQAEEALHQKIIELAYKGSDTALEVALEVNTMQSVRQSFEKAHQKLFGFVFPDAAKVVIESLRLRSTLGSESLSRATLVEANAREDTANPTQTWRMYFGGDWHDALLIKRSQMTVGKTIAGPALITEPISTTVLEAGWQAKLDLGGSLHLSRAAKSNTNSKSKKTKSSTQQIALDHSEADPVRLELFNNIFMSIAEDMGVVLQKVSHSVNIKERLDFSCAIFDAEGRLIANAPHIPVHLGSMGDSVVSLIKAHGKALKPGQAYALNNPYNGGTHLPDVTVISPVFAQKEGGPPIFFVGSRGHHADIGGITPGSMPAGSISIEEEGVLFDNVLIMQEDTLLEEEIRRHLSTAAYPARNVDQNIDDLKAQLAANNCGQNGLYRAIKRYGLDCVQAYMGHMRKNAADSLRRVIPTLKPGSATSTMDDGSIIAVDISHSQDGKGLRIDFTGTSAAAPNNFNAPLSVTRAAVLYVFRTLSGGDIPLNDGCGEPLELIVPPGSLLSPSYPHAVVAGNVETSQVIVDTLYTALNALAGSQGTMNNFTFGDDRHQYYETICGGAGAGRGFAGTDAVQTHMTNSRLTDPEILEERFPVILEEFSIRRGSGGTGLFPGGCGARRKIRFLREMTASILSNRRKSGAPGLDGGGSGQPGANYLVTESGAKPLAGTVSVQVKAGEAILIETPGGGGSNSYLS